MGEVARVVVVFRSRLRPEAVAEYEALAPGIEALARAQPGFVSITSYARDDGERVSIVEMESEAAVAAWRAHPEHAAAQRRGRERLYAWYRIQVCRVLRESEHEAEPKREGAPSADL